MEAGSYLGYTAPAPPRYSIIKLYMFRFSERSCFLVAVSPFARHHDKGAVDRVLSNDFQPIDEKKGRARNNVLAWRQSPRLPPCSRIPSPISSSSSSSLRRLCENEDDELEREREGRGWGVGWLVGWLDGDLQR